MVFKDSKVYLKIDFRGYGLLTPNLFSNTSTQEWSLINHVHSVSQMSFEM